MADLVKGIFVEFGADTVKFDNSVKGVNRALALTKNELANVNKQLKLDPKNVDLVKQKMDILKNSSKLAQDKVDALKAELNQMGQEEIGSNKWIALKKQINTAETEVKQYGAALDVTKAKLDTFTGQKFKDLSAGAKSAADQVRGISVAAGAALGSLVAIGVKAGASADDINTLAKITGASTKELQEFAYMAPLVDVSMEDMAKAQKRLTKSVMDGKDPSSEFSKNLASIGVSAVDSSGNLKDVNTLLFDTIDGMRGMEEGAERDALATDLFGKSGTMLNPIIEETAENIKAMRDEANRSGAVLSQEQLDTANEFNDVIDKLKGALSGTFMQVGVQIGKALQPLAEKLPGIVTSITAFVSALPPGFVIAILGVLSALTLLFPVLMAISVVAGAVASVMTAVASGAAAAALAAAAAAAPFVLVGLAIAGVIAVLVLLYNKCDAFRNIINIVAGVIKGIFVGAFNSLKSVINFVMPILEALGRYLKAVLSVAFEAVSKVVKDVVTKIKDLWAQFKDTSFGKGLIDIFEKIKKVVDDVAGAFKTAGEWLKKIKGSTIDKLNSSAASLSNRAQGMAGASGGFGASPAFAAGGYGAVSITSNITINNSGGTLSQSNAALIDRRVGKIIDEALGRRV